MFVTAKKHQSVLDENIRLRKYNEELVEKNETITDTLRTKYTRELDNVRYDQERALKSKVDDFNDCVIDKDNQITKLQNEVERVRTEGEARLALAEDIHQDEIIALEEKYDAILEIKNEEMTMKRDAFFTEADIVKQKRLAEAEREGAEIIQKALDNVQVIYKNALDLLTARLKDLPTMTSAEIINLIKASTENYPALPETLTSTSSSK